MAKATNRLEEFVVETLRSALRLRFDICACDLCLREMAAAALAELPGIPASPSPRPEEIKLQYQRPVTHACLMAIEKVSAAPPHIVLEDRKSSFQGLMNQILKDRNLDLRHYHSELLKRRIALRLHALKLASYREYMKYLDSHPHEYDHLFATLCINVSEFFRDTPVWVTMRYLLENLINGKIAKGEKNVRIWSAGCANGEEPFSLAILLREVTRHRPEGLELQLIATDIDTSCLRFCENAAYAAESLANADKALVERYFTRENGKFRPQQELRALVNFSYLDLTSADLIEHCDLIVCRNVFIYFDHNLQQKVLSKFCDALVTGGFLVMGKTELLPAGSSCRYEEVDGNARIYRKK